LKKKLKNKMKQYSEAQKILMLTDVSLGYEKNKPILKHINLTEFNVLREGVGSTGQIIAFIGRSGRGKSTLFKGLTGLLQPSDGNIYITNSNGQDVNDAKILTEGDVGFVDQKYTLFRHKTITQICEYALRKSKATKVEKTELINGYLEDWGLLEHKDKYSCELSGGQRQRTAIIEKMLTDKHFMILDEPFSGLDVGNIEKVKQNFQRISDADELNTIIFSTHDIRLAVELADSIYIVGFPDGVTDYSTIVGHYDLKKMGLAWEEYGDGHRVLVSDIKELLMKS
jgi:ABC-type nitrate/sulfonate/bicarbonate transport system ATPase subunit